MIPLPHPFLTRFAHSSPPAAEPRTPRRIASLKGLSSLREADIARLRRGGPRYGAVESTFPETTQFGWETDFGQPDADAD